MAEIACELELACRGMRRHLETAHRNGQMPLGLVLCPATGEPDPLRVVFDQTAVHCALGRPGARVRRLPEIQADWIGHFRDLIAGGLAPLGLVLVNASGTITAGPWDDALACFDLSEERFQEAVLAAITDVLPAAALLSDENPDDFPTRHAC